MLKKLLAGTALLTAVLVSGCNLSTQAAAQEVAINLATLEVSPTSTLALTPLPTRTPIDAPAPTLIALGGTAIPQPASLNLSGTVIPPTQPPPQGICSAKPTGSFDVNIRMGAGTNFGIITALHAGQYAQVLNRSDVGWLRVNMDGYGQGWVSGKVVTLFGPCNGLPVEAVATISGLAIAPSMTPTPTAMFGSNIGIPQNNIITKVTIGSIPAGTTVMISTAMFTGSGYIYDIMTVDGRFEKATDAQLMFSSGGGLMPFPTPTTYVGTPTAVFQNEIGIGQKRVVTTAQVGDIPAGTTVQIGSAYFDGTSWKYDIYMEDGRHATASEFQLTYDVTRRPGPTPTALFGFTMNIPLNRLITKEKVGDIPAGTTVVVTSTQFNGDFYLYGIMTVDGRSAMATDSQLAYSAGGGSIPFPSPTATASVPVMDLPTGTSPSDVVIPDGLCTVTAIARTNLYASPNVSASVVGVMNPGPWAQVGATNGQGWYKVTIWTDGRQGWGNTSTLTLHGPCDSLPTQGG